jgi:hypothetical protein
MKEAIPEETNVTIELIDGWKEKRPPCENRRQRVARKRREAERRQKLREARGHAGQIDRLDSLGMVAERERARLEPRAIAALKAQLEELAEASNDTTD